MRPDLSAGRLPRLALLALLGSPAAAGCAARVELPVVPDASFMARVETQVAFGPRVPGSEAHRLWLAAMEDSLRASGARVTEQAFDDTVPGFGPAHLTNVIASFGPAGGDRLLYAAHWDSRPWCDRDPDPAWRQRPLPGANDGASGVAVLLCLAQAFRASPPAGGVDLVFLDGEDLGTHDHPEGFFRGSRRFAALPHARYRMGLLLDMVGGRGARFPREPNSMLSAPEAVRTAWAEAARLRLDAFSDDVGPTIDDDHVPLNKAGIPTADIIDIGYPEWHTHLDLPAAMEPQGMAACFKLLASLALRR